MVERFSICLHWYLCWTHKENCFLEFTNSICIHWKKQLKKKTCFNLNTPTNPKIDRLVSLQLSCFQQSEAVDKIATILSPVGWVGWYLRVPNKQDTSTIFEHIQKTYMMSTLAIHLHSLNYSTPQSSHLALGRYNELRSLHCHTTQGSGVEALLWPRWTKHASHRFTKESES